MPLTRIFCADPGLKKEGRQVALPMAECLKCAATRNNPCNFTYEMLKSMYEGQQNRGDNISTTAVLAKCPRQFVLERREPYAQYPQELWDRYRGTIIHRVLEENMAPGDWGEVRVWAPVPGLGGEFISCQPDLVSPSQGILWDYKTAKSDSLPKYGDPWPDHEAQLQVNRWIIDNAVEVEAEDGVRVPLLDSMRPDEWTSLKIVYVTDKTMAVYDVTKSIQVPKVDGNGTKAKRVVDIWSDDQVLNYMVPRYVERRQALEMYPQEVPPVPEEYRDRSMTGFPCDWCPVRKDCFELQLAGQ